MGPLVHPTNRDLFAACPSVHPSVCPPVRPERFPGICRRTHGRNCLKFCMLMYLGHLQNWWDYGHGLLIFLFLASLWLSEMGQIWGFRTFPGGRIVGMALNFECWCIMTIFKIISLWSQSIVFCNFGVFLLSEMGQIWGFRAFRGEPFEEVAWNFACWCIVSTFSTDKIMIVVSSFF